MTYGFTNDLIRSCIPAIKILSMTMLAARWLNIPRVTFLVNAMEAGAELLEDSEDDLNRELALL